jgi:hypothetical protein
MSSRVSIITVPLENTEGERALRQGGLGDTTDSETDPLGLMDLAR